MATGPLGHENKSSLRLRDKITATSKAGFGGIELEIEDVVRFASEHHHCKVGPKEYDALVSAADGIRTLCNESNLQVSLLKTFANFAGWPEGSLERKEAFERLTAWIRIMLALQCHKLQVASSEASGDNIGTDSELAERDLQFLAGRLAENGLDFAYEN